jgi:hypothetical protein
LRCYVEGEWMASCSTFTQTPLACLGEQSFSDLEAAANLHPHDRERQTFAGMLVGTRRFDLVIHRTGPTISYSEILVRNV